MSVCLSTCSTSTRSLPVHAVQNDDFCTLDYVTTLFRHFRNAGTYEYGASYRTQYGGLSKVQCTVELPVLVQVQYILASTRQYEYSMMNDERVARAM